MAEISQRLPSGLRQYHFVSVETGNDGAQCYLRCQYSQSLPRRYRFTCGNGALRYMGISILLSCLSKYQPAQGILYRNWFL